MTTAGLQAAELAALAARVRAFAPPFAAQLREVATLAGPDTWQGRIAEVFREELLAEMRELARLHDLLAVIAQRLELRAADMQAFVAASTGEGDLPG